MADEVQLTDLTVIQQFSLAVRGATADRDEVVAALEADLAWLRGGTAKPSRPASRSTAARTTAAPAKKAAARTSRAAKA